MESNDALLNIVESNETARHETGRNGMKQIAMDHDRNQQPPQRILGAEHETNRNKKLFGMERN